MSEGFWSKLVRISVSRPHGDNGEKITKLMGAARRGDVERCAWLLGLCHGAARLRDALEAEDRSGRTPLAFALDGGAACARFFLERGANPLPLFERFDGGNFDEALFREAAVAAAQRRLERRLSGAAEAAGDDEAGVDADGSFWLLYKAAEFGLEDVVIANLDAVDYVYQLDEDWNSYSFSENEWPRATDASVRAFFSHKAFRLAQRAEVADMRRDQDWVETLCDEASAEAEE
jgi:hypothetical protein